MKLTTVYITAYHEIHCSRVGGTVVYIFAGYFPHAERGAKAMKYRIGLLYDMSNENVTMDSQVISCACDWVH